MKKLKFTLTALLLAASSLCGNTDTNATVDTNSTKPKIINFIDMNMMNNQFAYTERVKENMALVFVADWCQASRHLLANVKAFEDLWGDDTAIILVNAGNNPQWIINRYNVNWRVIDGPARQDLVDWFGVRHVPEFVLVNTKTGGKMNREQWKALQGNN